MFEKALPEDSNLFGSQATLDTCDIAILPVPWEATTSYGQGTAFGPDSIRKASLQLDFFEKDFSRVLDEPIYMLPTRAKWMALSKETREKAAEFRRSGDSTLRTEINRASQTINQGIFDESSRLLDMGKKVGLLGGDHSSPFGFIQALSRIHTSFGILHLDAHHDLRDGYEGFHFSHASIMFQVLKDIPSISHLVSVGIRDFSKEEYDFAQDEPVIHTFYDQDLHARQFEGTSWRTLSSQILDQLPQKVYISFDIDSLNPSLCPHTGTPVPGGLSFEQVSFTLQQFRQSGKTLIGFDLCEVSPPEFHPMDCWDANVGARVLHQLCSLLHDTGSSKPLV